MEDFVAVNKKTRSPMTYTRAINLQKTCGNCTGLSDFLMGPEARQYFKRGLKFYGVKFHSILGTSHTVPVSKEPNTIHYVAIDNKYGDFAMFYDPTEK
jgi:hypothetical protein